MYLQEIRYFPIKLKLNHKADIYHVLFLDINPKSLLESVQYDNHLIAYKHYRTNIRIEKGYSTTKKVNALRWWHMNI